MFDSVQHIHNCALILDRDGSWPNFHDAEIHDLKLWRGDVRLEDNKWVGPVVEVTIELLALAEPFVTVMKFHDCDAMEISGFNHQNAIQSLDFSFEGRGFYTSGVPLPPYIRVTFKRGFGLDMAFRCLRIEVLERREAVVAG